MYYKYYIHTVTYGKAQMQLDICRYSLFAFNMWSLHAGKEQFPLQIQ